MEKPVLDTPIWKILVTVVIAAAALFLWTALYRILARGRSEAHIIVLLLRVLSPIAGLAILMALRYFLSFHLVIVGRFSQIVDVTYSIIFYFGMAWICWIAIVAFFEVVLVSPNHSGESLDANMLRLTARILALVGSIFILAYGAQAIGLPVLSLLTGLGIGGLAIALAIRPTLENLIGGFILYIDRPVRVGDFCEFDDRSGTVETIGVRSTQVRTLERTLVSISVPASAGIIITIIM